MQSLHVMSMLCPCPVHIVSMPSPSRFHVISCPFCWAHQRHWSFGCVLLYRCSQDLLSWLTGLQRGLRQSRGTINTSQRVLLWLKPRQHPHLNHRSLWNTPRPSQPLAEEWFTMVTGGWCNLRGMWTGLKAFVMMTILWFFLYICAIGSHSNQSI